MQRYFVPKENFSEDSVTINGEDVHHIARVMRGEPGDEIICSSPDGQAAICVIHDISPETVVAKIVKWLDEDKEMPIEVTIAQGIPKGDKMDLILQKGTELGMASFIPFKAARSIPKWDEKKFSKKLSRWEKITKEASEQSHRSVIPAIKQQMDINELVEETASYDVKLFAYEEEAKVANFASFGKIVGDIRPGQRVVICIGPEGGFTEGEATFLKDRDFLPIRLGPRILRTETASLYALASLSYHFEEVGCKE